MKHMKHNEGEQNVRYFFPRIEVVVLLLFLAFQESREVIALHKNREREKGQEKTWRIFARDYIAYFNIDNRRNGRKSNQFLSLPTHLEWDYQGHIFTSDNITRERKRWEDGKGWKGGFVMQKRQEILSIRLVLFFFVQCLFFYKREENWTVPQRYYLP